MRCYDNSGDTFTPLCDCCYEPIEGEGVEQGGDLVCESCARPVDPTFADMIVEALEWKDAA